MNEIWIIIALVMSIIFGILIGYFLAKFLIFKKNKEILKNAKQILEGKRENKTTIKGVSYDASKTRLRLEDGREIIVDLKGGIIKDAKKRKEKSRDLSKKNNNLFEQNNKNIREDGKKFRKKKRNIGKFRRFG